MTSNAIDCIEIDPVILAKLLLILLIYCESHVWGVKIFSILKTLIDRCTKGFESVCIKTQSSFQVALNLIVERNHAKNPAEDDYICKLNWNLMHGHVFC